ncbi:hypothetical protein ACFRJ8_19135 [Arthrobacter sp. NPDC056886]|uniref:hypothetical protein n=1 Tax=Arthrobacter sp. NPDC056886 TaxID=3345960 RepID=UPI0036713219
MTDNTGNALDSAALRPGDHIDVHVDEHTRYSAYVDDTMPQLNIVWIRELRTGERRMLSTDEHRLYRSVT